MAGAVGAVTTIVNGVSDALVLPLLTEMTMLLYELAWPAAGVPVSAPVTRLKLAHAGLLLIE